MFIGLPPGYINKNTFKIAEVSSYHTVNTFFIIFIIIYYHL